MRTKTNPTSNAEQVANEAIEIMAREITDRIFLIIEENKGLSRDYLRAVELQGLNKVNQDIGRIVKKRFHLENEGRSKKKPKSKLILSYEEHALRGG